MKSSVVSMMAGTTANAIIEGSRDNKSTSHGRPVEVVIPVGSESVGSVVPRRLDMCSAAVVMASTLMVGANSESRSRTPWVKSAVLLRLLSANAVAQVARPTSSVRHADPESGLAT